MKTEIINGITTLFADEGKRLTDGSAIGSVISLGKEDTGEQWYEITEAEAEERMNEEHAEDEATEADYQAALREMGVKV